MRTNQLCRYSLRGFQSQRGTAEIARIVGGAAPAVRHQAREFSVSQIPVAQATSQKLALRSRAGIFHRGSHAKREYDPLTGDASQKLKCPIHSRKTDGSLLRHVVNRFWSRK